MDNERTYMAVTLTFLGAAGTVTGSKYLLRTARASVLIDCGLFQGEKNLRELNWQPLPFRASQIDSVVLTHAHLDHVGYLPRIVRQGFKGPVWCSRATGELARIILEDSAKLQESLKGGQLQGIVKVAEEIRDKKKNLDQIRGSLDEMITMSDNLAKRITLLSREAKLLEIRVGGGGGGGAPSEPGAGGGEGGIPTETAVRKKLELSQEEEIEFRRQREELKKLIQRLWE